MAKVELRQVTKKFGETEVIPELDLEIEDKEFVVLVGPSGCGKTTTLRMIAGLEEVTDGRILIGTKDVTTVRPGLRNCAMVFQNYALYPHMTVRENITYGLKVRKTSPQDIDRLVGEATRVLGLDDYLERRPRELSGGQQQRVAIGRAIVRQPEVFLFDEPLSNLDAKLRVEMRTEIKRLHRRLQNTVVYVTHDQVEAMTLADRVVVMNQGRIEQVASPIELYQQPTNTFVAAFIGAPAMNFLKADVIELGAGRGLRLGDGTELPLDREQAKLLAGAVGRPVILGLRPEHIEGGDQGKATIRFAPQAIEPLGPHTLLIGSLNDAPFTAQVDVQFKATPEERCTVSVDMTKAHLFDQGTGSAIRKPA